MNEPRVAKGSRMQRIVVDDGAHRFTIVVAHKVGSHLGPAAAWRVSWTEPDRAALLQLDRDARTELTQRAIQTATRVCRGKGGLIVVGLAGGTA
jgi:hypothetical protein